MILDAFDDLNWGAVGVALAAAFAIGLVWFTPSVMGRFWARRVSGYTGVPAHEIEAEAGRPRPLSLWLVGFAGNAIVLGLAIKAIGADSAGEGILVGVVLGIGLGSTLSSWPPIFARMPWAWWLVNNAPFLLIQVAMGAILGAWE